MGKNVRHDRAPRSTGGATPMEPMWGENGTRTPKMLIHREYHGGISTMWNAGPFTAASGGSASASRPKPGMTATQPGQRNENWEQGHRTSRQTKSDAPNESKSMRRMSTFSTSPGSAPATATGPWTGLTPA